MPKRRKNVIWGMASLEAASAACDTIIIIIRYPRQIYIKTVFKK
jgi:hypothetical protein